MKTFLIVIGLIVLLALLLCLVLYRFLKQLIKKRDHLLGSDYCPTLSVEFVGTSPARFRIPYELTWRVERLNPFEFLLDWMFMKEIYTGVAEQYNSSFFLPDLEKHAIQLRLGADDETAEGTPDQTYATLVKRDEADGQSRYRNLSPKQLIEEVRLRPLEIGGCRFSVCGFEFKEPTHEVIEENYAMLNEADKEKVEDDKRFLDHEEKLAVALLRRRLEFLRSQSKQVRDSNMVSITTERVGSGLKISWIFHRPAQSGYDLVGFRRTGSFFPDKWDEKNNGALVIEDHQSGEVTEPLKEGETYFYTFILKPWPNTRNETRYSIARFQVTIATKEETDAIEAMIRRAEEKGSSSKQRNGKLDQALEALWSFGEFESVFDMHLKKMIGEIEKTNLSSDEKQEKIDRLREMGTTLREEYQN